MYNSKDKVYMTTNNTHCHVNPPVIPSRRRSLRLRCREGVLEGVGWSWDPGGVSLPPPPPANNAIFFFFKKTSHFPYFSQKLPKKLTPRSLSFVFFRLLRATFLVIFREIVFTKCLFFSLLLLWLILLLLIFSQTQEAGSGPQIISSRSSFDIVPILRIACGNIHARINLS